MKIHVDQLPGLAQPLQHLVEPQPLAFQLRRLKITTEMAAQCGSVHGSFLDCFGGLPQGAVGWQRGQHVLAGLRQRVQLRKVPNNPIRHPGQRLLLVILAHLVVLELAECYVREGNHRTVGPAVAPARRDMALDRIETLGAAL